MHCETLARSRRSEQYDALWPVTGVVFRVWWAIEHGASDITSDRIAKHS
jgi:hypothetical protein